MSDVFVYSTLATDMAYTIYANEHQPNELSIIEKQIYIRGKAGVVDPKSMEGAFYTPKGMCTRITEEELALLEAHNHVFRLHVEKGHIVIERKEKSIEKVVEGMNQKENSSPITPDEFITNEDGIKKLKPRGNK